MQKKSGWRRRRRTKAARTADETAPRAPAEQDDRTDDDDSMATPLKTGLERVRHVTPSPRHVRARVADVGRETSKRRESSTRAKELRNMQYPYPGWGCIGGLKDGPEKKKKVS